MNPRRLKLLFLASLMVGLSGCAVLSPEQARTMTSFDLCRVIYDSRINANSRPVAAFELNQRQYDCANDRDAIFTSLQIEAQRAAAMGAIGAQLLKQSQPQPLIIQQQQPTNCRIIRGQYGDRVYCN